MNYYRSGLLFISTAAFALSLQAAPPKLVLQITVDQLRADLPFRHIEKMGHGGFSYLYDNGIVYKNAYHSHANTETIVGHSTLATGAPPSVHGMVGNVWYDYEKKRLVYNIEDEDHPLLSENADVNQKTELDPTQKTAKVSGRSPRNLMVSTFSDELVLFTAGRSKIFGVSVKDRGAVSMAGHAGKAFWFSKKNGDFVTSEYYYKQYPEWVTEWNAKDSPLKYADKNWELQAPIETYTFGDMDDAPWEVDFPGYGRTFPHAFGPSDNPYFNTLLTISPAGDELTLEFAKELIENESIGADSTTDYLSISFSSTDYVGHFFGPSSLEMEENMLRLDKTLASLFSYIDERIGLDNVLIALSSDHGGAEAPGYLNEIGIDATYVNPKEWEKEAAFSKLKETFGIDEELIQSFYPPYLYLNNEAIDERGLDRDTVERAIAEELSKFPGVHLAVTRNQIERNEIAYSRVTQAVHNNHNVKRSGNIYVVFQPHCFINDMDGLEVAVHHGSPWNYDAAVPIIFAGYGLTPKTIYREVCPTDIAPTLSAIVNAKAPSGATGKVLTEVLEN